MAENAQKIKYGLIEAAGQKVLFTPLRIDRDTIPNGYYCYDIRDDGYGNFENTTIENFVTVNHLGTIIAQTPFEFDGKVYIDLEDGINFLSIPETTLQEFMEKGPLRLIIEYGLESERKEFCRVSITADSSDSVKFYISNTPECEEDLLSYDKTIEFLERLPAGDDVSADVHSYVFGSGGIIDYANEDEMAYIREHFDEMDAAMEVSCINECHYQIQNVYNNTPQILVLIVEPEKPPYVSTIDNSLKGLQAVVDGSIEYVQLDKNTSFVCHDEGKLLGLKGNRNINGDIIAGTFLICGDDGYGNSISLTSEQIALYSERFAEPEHYTDEQVQDAIYCEITNYGNLNDLLNNLIEKNEDDEEDLEV
jgi:hypothetical protein